MKTSDAWPALPLAAWKDTYATLHMWTQIAGKIRLALSPLINHFWGTTLYVTSRGLTTSPMPCANGAFEIVFDFIAHTLEISTSRGERRSFCLVPHTVAEFYAELMAALHSLGIDVKIWTVPVEVPRPVRFTLDEAHSSYDPEYAHRFWHILVSVDTVFQQFRSRFIGKVSPVHFFWGSFDLAVTRFSGRRASSSIICRRRGSAMALNTSDAEEVRDMPGLYSHYGICQAGSLFGGSSPDVADRTR